MTSTVRDTPLRAVHERLGATMTDFAGWLMPPLRYGSETAEHNAVRALLPGCSTCRTWGKSPSRATPPVPRLTTPLVFG